jgi:hypothetical protein
MYAYFSDQIGGDWSHTRVASSHSYYRTLYGKRYEAFTELALTFMLLYDSVWMAPADNHMPTSRLASGNNSYIPELGLHIDSDGAYHDMQDERRRHVDRYLADEQLQQILSSQLRIPSESWELVVDAAVYEAGLSAHKRIPLLCSPGRRKLIDRLIAIDKPALYPVTPGEGEVRFIDSYREVTGMALAPKNLDALMDSKPDPAVRAYSTNFLKIALSDQGLDGSNDNIRMKELIREAVNTERISKLYAGRLKWAAWSFHLLPPHYGLPLTALARVGSYVANQYAASAGWYEFYGSINRAIDRAELIR